YATGLTLEILRYLKKERPNLAEEFPSLKELATRSLAQVGDVAGLEWARANGYFDAAEVCEGASQGGQLAVLKWARENGFPTQAVNCDALARGSHLECLKWAAANERRLTRHTCAAAAEGDELS